MPSNFSLSAHRNTQFDCIPIQWCKLHFTCDTNCLTCENLQYFQPRLLLHRPRHSIVRSITTLHNVSTCFWIEVVVVLVILTHVHNWTCRTVDFHGELNADARIGVIASIKQTTERASILVLEKCISSYISVRPASPSRPWSPCWNEYLIHHKSWELLNEAEVLPLISKRFVAIDI